MRTRIAFLATALTVGFGATAAAFAPVPKGERGFETAGVAPPRAWRTFSVAPPGAAIDRLRAAGFGRVRWDADTGTPGQMYGAGLSAPGSIHDAAIAESVARGFLADHLATLAPGATLADFQLVSNVQSGDLRAVGFAQTWRGLRVIGAEIGFVFKADRLALINSSALPDITAVPGNPTFRTEVLAGAARQWIASITGATAVAEPPASGTVVLPIIRNRKGAVRDIEFRVVQTVPVALSGAVGKWDVYVDASTALPVARRSLIHFATGTVRYNAPERWPGGTRTNYPATFATHNINGASVTSTGNGQVTWNGTAAATVRPGLVGPKVRMHSPAGLASTTLNLQPGGAATWNESATEAKDAQLTSFIHANIVKAYIKANIAPQLAPYLDSQLDVYVNESGQCNAYSTGDDIHFFPSSSQCENTGRMADVVYHEFGHSTHAHAVIDGVGEFDGGVSEGMSDFLAATINNDPAMGVGFFHTAEPLRHIDPPVDKVWPDDATGEPHADGEIIAGAMWDTRKALVASLGATPGVRRAEKIWYHILEISRDIPTSFGAALLADDDDGNLDNGTPNECAIRTAFAQHGLAEVDVGPSTIGFPLEDGLEISVPVTVPQGSQCPPPDISAGSLLWQVRGGTDSGRLDLVKTDLGGGMSTWSATLPAQPENTVLRYRVELDLTDGGTRGYPNNPADSYYELYVGAVVPIWCDDFEASAAQWTHGSDMGADEWGWGPAASTSGDPPAAYSGERLFGTAIGADYSRDTSQWARTPEVDTSAYHDGVRLQYRRWLNVEDGFFDVASISGDSTPLWSNFDSMQGDNSNVHHRDREWRFHDVDLTEQAADGKVQVEFRLDSDPGLQFGGWNLDDVCIVARVPGGICGDGMVGSAEQCDDGNTTDGDGCSATCTNEDTDHPPGDDGGCCSTGTDPKGALLLGLCTLGLVWRRRRRR